VTVLIAIVWPLLGWNVIYCALKTWSDFRDSTRSKTVGGLLALLGSLGMFGIAAYALTSLGP
jgi:hypothetical protein